MPLGSSSSYMVSYEGLNGVVAFTVKRVSMGYWLLQLTVNILAFLRLTVIFLPLRLTGVVKIDCFCSKKLKNKKVFLCVYILSELYNVYAFTA